jgi:hypothetical protein
MKPLGLQNEFNAGQKRDFSRNRMPPNSAWTLKDVILDYGAPARERGGWAHASASVSAASGGSGATYMRGGIYVIFSPSGGSDPANLAQDEDGLLYEIAANGTVTLIGTSVTLLQNPVFHGGVAASAASAVYTGLVIIPDGTGAAVPKVYDGTTLDNLHGTPPKARFAAVYKDYTVLANGTVGSTYFPNRIWFSPPGDPDCFGTSGVTVWDTTDSWIDFSTPVRALAATKNVLFVFGDGQLSRVRGSVPPPDADMVPDDPWMQIGLLDPMSITSFEDVVYWCAPEGVFKSDGVYVDNIAAKGGMLRHWLDLAASATSAYSFAAGIIRNKLVISVMNGGTFVDAFMVDLKSFAWTQLTNLDANAFWNGTTGGLVSDDTFFSRREQAYVGRLDSMFAEVDDATFKSDGDGTAVAAVIETPFYELGRPGIKNVKGILVGYHLADHASDNPTFEVSYVSTPDDTSYTSLGTLSETTEYDRRRLQLGGRFWGLGLKLTRANAGDFHLFDIAAEVSFQEESKRKS